MSKVSISILIGVLLVTLTSCNNARQAPQDAFTWNLEVIGTKVEKQLDTQKGTVLYDGSVLEQGYSDIPADGNVYLLIDLAIKKQQSGNNAFKWSDLTVLTEEGTTYLRMNNDTFIENHNYTRMQGTDLQLGENRGWICIELPEQTTKNKIYLLHTTNEGVNKIQIK